MKLSNVLLLQKEIDNAASTLNELVRSATLNGMVCQIEQMPIRHVSGRCHDIVKVITRVDPSVLELD